MDEASRGAPWLSIIGLGEDGLAGLGEAARAALAGAGTVFGGARHLRLAAGGITGMAQSWPSPFSVAPVLALRGQAVAVLASGDPMWHGVGATLLRDIPAGEARVFPQASAASLAATRMGWPLAEVTVLSLHARDPALLRPHLHPGARLILLTSDAAQPAAIAALLAAEGFATSAITVLEALGGSDERLRHATAAAFDLDGIHPLNTLAIEVLAGPDARWLPRAPGLPDDLFQHDGQLTKREVRAITLAALRPFPGALLWDVGAGAGSIGIEWMLAHPACRAIGIEVRADRAARAEANARALGVPGLRLVSGEAPAAFAGLPPPDALFLGGGANDPCVFDAALAALKRGGVFVANAVTLETEALLLARHAALGGELLRIGLSRAVAVGGMTGWRPAMPVTQWVWHKP
ncbi:precorrin-6y C5,15-methyltransferase (decarboxylating) subunit CbiE [Falsiroseomonas sp.]|uniref:precorrin-6y C5,15-methyltransferase (decarboxylating) subunit CbiE n=1 Tax=Falsiroseomonas sp. TaxID=2870721 RepID=UPI002733C6A6|nr:precorrin-6y C5,15-methyltransferase (decarboxylating) subunit CbiE [Falsiroseomonas sp.]MDP3416526.1 precorrin-6y C5,15-methyltransferase (decarboxylating) subunit CbiE [Falsiroseomonas sp.]